MHSKVSYIGICVFFLWIHIFSTPIIFAAETSTPAATLVSSSPLNISISPVTLVIEAKPGETITTALKVRNNGSETEQLNIKVGSFIPDLTGERPQLIDPDPNEDFLSWLSVSKTSFQVASSEWETIDVTFSPPQTAALSYYYTLYIERSGKVLVKPGETSVEGSAAILVLANVISPLAKRELQLEEFSLKKTILEFLPQPFSLKIKNTGNVHVMPMGNIFIDGQGQKDVAVLSINPNNSAILPQSARTFTINWNDGFPVVNSETGDLTWNFDVINHFRFGKYTAHAVLVYDNGERDVPIESFISFWVIPWRLLALVIAIPVIPAISVFIFMKWKYGKKN
jgi:hypothetical protein